MTSHHPIIETLSEDQSESVRKVSCASDLPNFENFNDPSHFDQNKHLYPNFTPTSGPADLTRHDLTSRVNGDGWPHHHQKERHGSFARKSSDGNTDRSDSSVKKKFVKIKPGGVQDTEPAKAWDEDINYSFAQEKENFIGQFQTDEYRVQRGYLDGHGVQLRLYYTKLEPTIKAVASLCIVHGLGEHCGRYMEMADHFAKQGYYVHMIDLRGFGQSGYPRAHGSVEEYHRDIEVLLKLPNKNLPLFIYCHSMGCAITSSFLIRNPYLNIAGVILTSGLFGFPKDRDMNWGRRFAIKLLGKHLGEVVLNAGINPTGLSRNNYNVRKLFDDRLTIPIIDMKMASTLVNLIEFVLPKAHKYPCLIIHGDADTVTPHEDSIRFYKRISSEDKTFKSFEGGYHELQYDHEKETLKKIMSDWLNQRVSKSPRPLGDLPPLKVGIFRKDIPQKIKIIVLAILTLLYFVYLKRFRGHKLYSTSLSILFYPLFYIKNVLLKKHGWKI